MRTTSYLLCSLLLISAVQAEDAGPKKTPEQQAASAALAEGNTLRAAGKTAEALTKYKEGLAKQPDNANLLWNAGIAAHELGELDFELQCWKKMRTVEPDNWRVRAKLIQLYQAKGLTKERDDERKELLAIYAKKPAEDMLKQKSFCREQFVVAKRKVMALEHFELTDDKPVRYAFAVLTDEGEVDFEISLGSHPMTNAFMKEQGLIKPGDRGFQLDGYYEHRRVHKTFAIYNAEPTYDEVRQKFVDIMDGKTQELSSTTGR